MSNEVLVSLWETKECSDVTIVFPDTTSIKAHRCILAASSAYFRTLLSETKDNEIPDNEDPEIMYSLLEYWYTGEIQPELTNGELLKFALLALKFEAIETILNKIVNVMISRTKTPLSADDFVNFANFSTKFKNNFESVSNLHIRLAREFLGMKTFDTRLDFSTVASWLKLLQLGSNLEIIFRFGNYCLNKNVALDKCKPWFIYLLSFVDNLFLLNLQKFGVSDFEILEQHLLRKVDSVGLAVSQKVYLTPTSWRLTINSPTSPHTNVIKKNRVFPKPKVEDDYDVYRSCALVEPNVIYTCQFSGNYMENMVGVIAQRCATKSWVEDDSINCLFYPRGGYLVWGSRYRDQKKVNESLTESTQTQMRTIVNENGVRFIQFRTTGKEWVTAKQDNDEFQLLMVVGVQLHRISLLVGDKIIAEYGRKKSPATIKKIKEDGTYHILIEGEDKIRSCSSSCIPWIRLSPVEITIRANPEEILINKNAYE